MVLHMSEHSFCCFQSNFKLFISLIYVGSIKVFLSVVINLLSLIYDNNHLLESLTKELNLRKFTRECLILGWHFWGLEFLVRDVLPLDDDDDDDDVDDDGDNDDYIAFLWLNVYITDIFYDNEFIFLEKRCIERLKLNRMLQSCLCFEVITIIFISFVYQFLYNILRFLNISDLC